jgi:hypothetical protein
MRVLAILLLGAATLRVQYAYPLEAPADPDCVGGYSVGHAGTTSSILCGDKQVILIPRRGRRVLPVVQQDPMTARGCTQLQASMTATRQPDGWLCPMRKRTPPDPNDPATIARQAALDLIAHHGSVGVLPGRTITGLPTYFWLEGVGTRTADRTRAGWHLHIVARPASYTWQFGDGHQLTGGPGHAEPPQTSEIAHTYDTLGHYDISVEVTWRVTFQVNGTSLPAPGTFTTTATTPLTVDELRIRLTG